MEYGGAVSFRAFNVPAETRSAASWFQSAHIDSSTRVEKRKESLWFGMPTTCRSSDALELSNSKRLSKMSCSLVHCFAFSAIAC